MTINPSTTLVLCPKCGQLHPVAAYELDRLGNRHLVVSCPNTKSHRVYVKRIDGLNIPDQLSLKAEKLQRREENNRLQPSLL